MGVRRFLLAAAMLAGLSLIGSTGASAQGAQVFAVLLGGNEVSASPAAGDLNGFGAATVVFTKNNQICWTIVVHAIDTPTLAHIHKERAGVNGPISINLTPPSSGSAGTSSGCVNADKSIISDIRKNPSDYYVNVHTGAFPGGALRGQLF